MYRALDDYFSVPQALKSCDAITPVKTLPETGHHWVTGVTRSGRKLSNRDVLVMNSTAQNHEENSPALPCELSSINVALSERDDQMLKKPTETPAKIFARMKAKVQRESGVGRGVASDHEMCKSIPSTTKTESLQMDHTDQETYVLALSPPQSPGGCSQDEELVPDGQDTSSLAG